MMRYVLAMCVIGVLVCPASAADDPAEDKSTDAQTVPFSMPIPEGWRTETIPFPPEFAPTLDYEGLEELRFAPGMFDYKSDDFWTYAFVWWLPEDTKMDARILESDLKIYFDGLARAVAESKEIDMQGAEARINLDEQKTLDSGYRRFDGQVEIFDAFVTRRVVKLNTKIEIWDCPMSNNRVVFFEFSPRLPSNEIWTAMAKIREGFQCEAQSGK